MYVKLDMNDFKNSGLTLEAFTILQITKILNRNSIKAYRKLISDITGFSPRSITRYYRELKNKGYTEQKTLYSPNSINYSKGDETKELFDKIYERIKSG